MLWFTSGKKRVDNLASDSKQSETKFVDGIEENDVFEHDGPVEVKGNIEDGAEVKISNGGIIVHGDVGMNVRISAKAGTSTASGNNIRSSGDVVVIASNISSSFVSVSSGQEASIEVRGDTADFVELSADFNIAVGNTGDGFIAKAGHSIKAQKLKSYAQLKAGHSIKLQDVGKESILRAGHTVKTNGIGEHSRVKAGHSFKAHYVDKNTIVRAGHSVKVDVAHVMASFKSGHKAKVGSTVGEKNHEKPSAYIKDFKF